MDLKAVFYDIPPNHIPCSEITANYVNESYSDINLLKDVYNEPRNIATLELNKWRLDGTYEVMQDNKIPYMSTAVSADTATNGRYYLSSSVTITKTFSDKQDIKGIMIVSGDECHVTYARVTWFEDDTIISQKNIYPDKNKYYYKNEVSGCNKIRIIIYALSKPNRFLTLFALLEAPIYEITGDGITSCSILKEKNILNTELPCDSLEMDIKIDPKEAFFSKFQQVSVFRGKKKMGTFYIDTAKQQNGSTFSVIAYNLFYMLDNYSLLGTYIGAAPCSTTPYELLGKVFENIPYQYSAPETSITLLSGQRTAEEQQGSRTNRKAAKYILLEKQNAREAILNIMLACKLRCDISESNEFVFSQWETATSTEINAQNTFADGNVTTDSRTVSIALKVNHYAAVTKWYQNSSNGNEYTWAECTTVNFPVKNHDINIYQGEELGIYYQSSIAGDTSAGLTFIETGMECPGYFKYRAEGETAGARMRIDRYVNYPDAFSVVINDDIVSENERMTIECALSQDPINDLEEHFKNYYKNDAEFEGNIVIPENMQCGDVITVPTEWQGDFTGIVEQIEYSFNGGQKLIGKVRVHAYG